MHELLSHFKARRCTTEEALSMTSVVRSEDRSALGWVVLALFLNNQSDHYRFPSTTLPPRLLH